VAVAGHFSSSADFSFKNVTWPEDLPPNWVLDSSEGGEHEAKITVTLNSEDENAEPSAELELDGEGAIQTLDWSSHQRRIAEEEEQSAWEMFSHPDGVGRVQALDNPPAVLLSILSVDLDAMKISHNEANGELPDSDETSPGAFVPINNDDDDYDASNTVDKDQSGSITGESDLLPIKLQKVDPAVTGSKYTLDIPMQVKIWQKSDRSGAVTGTTEFDANEDTTLYVEGVTVGSGNVKISWKNGTTTLDDCDEIKVTVYNWGGPLNVPGYGRYKYIADGNLPENADWIEVQGGEIVAGDGRLETEVIWGEGAVVGKVSLKANENYVWELEVNVVNIQIDNSYGVNGGQIAYADKNRPQQKPIQMTNLATGNPMPSVKSSVADRCILYGLRVSKIEGPTVNGERRGEKFIELGFSQQARIIKRNSVFNTIEPAIWQYNEYQNEKWYWDLFIQASKPFINKAVEEAYLNVVSDDENITNRMFYVWDNPVMSFAEAEVNFWHLGNVLDEVNLVLELETYFITKTKQNINDSEGVYVIRTKLPWKVDTSGAVNAERKWSLTGSGVTGPDRHILLAPGTVLNREVPDDIINTLLIFSEWFKEIKE
jgi:hypothetical protein